MNFRRNINTKILILPGFYEKRVLCVYLAIPAVKRSGNKIPEPEVAISKTKPVFLLRRS